jgi:hypothetical protein
MGRINFHTTIFLKSLKMLKELNIELPDDPSQNSAYESDPEDIRRSKMAFIASSCHENQRRMLLVC